MKFYLAAAFERKKEAQALATEIESQGHICVASWLKPGAEEELNREDETGGLALQRAKSDIMIKAEFIKIAQVDYEDIQECEWFICLSETEDTTVSRRGGRHVEYGYADAWDKGIIIVGPKENIFHYRDGTKLRLLFKAASDLLLFTQTIIDVERT